MGRALAALSGYTMQFPERWSGLKPCPQGRGTGAAVWEGGLSSAPPDLCQVDQHPTEILGQPCPGAHRAGCGSSSPPPASEAQVAGPSPSCPPLWLLKVLHLPVDV